MHRRPVSTALTGNNGVHAAAGTGTIVHCTGFVGGGEVGDEKRCKGRQQANAGREALSALCR